MVEKNSMLIIILMFILFLSNLIVIYLLFMNMRDYFFILYFLSLLNTNIKLIYNKLYKSHLQLLYLIIIL